MFPPPAEAPEQSGRVGDDVEPVLAIHVFKLKELIAAMSIKAVALEKSARIVWRREMHMILQIEPRLQILEKDRTYIRASDLDSGPEKRYDHYAHRQ